jgi:hypothetical protein
MGEYKSFTRTSSGPYTQQKSTGADIWELDEFLRQMIYHYISYVNLFSSSSVDDYSQQF